jgi:hypothetical protein
MLVTGKVQLKGEDVNIIVDRVETNLELARDADAPRTPPAPPPPAVSNGRSPTNGNGQPRPANGHAVPPAPADDSPVQAQSEGPPPPPPNFDEEMLAVTTAAPQAAGAKTAAAVKTAAAAKTAPDPTPPAPQTAKAAPAAPAVTAPAAVPPPPQRQTVVVEVRPVSNWRAIFRESVRLAGEFAGPDALTLKVSGQPQHIHLPNQQTLVCPELLERLRMQPGIARVYRE